MRHADPATLDNKYTGLIDFRKIGPARRLLEIAFPPLRRRREARLEREIQRLMWSGIDDEVRVR